MHCYTGWSKKSLCTWWLQYRKLQVTFKLSPASLQTFIDTRLTLTPSVIPNSNYVIMVSEWNCLKYFCLFFYCNHQVHRDFLITLYLSRYVPRVLKITSELPQIHRHILLLHMLDRNSKELFRFPLTSDIQTLKVNIYIEILFSVEVYHFKFHTTFFISQNYMLESLTL
jgi:hypothetical protein